MDRINELLGNITNLSDDELTELKDLILQEFDGADPEDEGSDAEGDPPPADGAGPPAAKKAAPPAHKAAPASTPVTVVHKGEGLELSVVEALAEAGQKVAAEFQRREDEKAKREAAGAVFDGLRNAGATATVEETAPAGSVTEGEGGGADTELSTKDDNVAPPADTGGGGNQNDEPEPVTAAGEQETTVPDAEVPEDRKPRRQVAQTTVIRAGADLPGIAMGSELTSRADLAAAMVRRINTMRGIRGGDGDKLIVASASLDTMTSDPAHHLTGSQAEENLQKVLRALSPEAITAAGGLGAPEESIYKLFGAGDTDRPVRSSLPVFTTERGGIRFMRPPTLADVAGVVGIWTVANDIAAATDVNVRKPSFRVLPGPEIVVDTQAITMIMTFGNLMARAYPVLVARHNDLGLIAHARVAEQQLLTQIGALSTAVTGRTQQLGATREVLMQVARASASYRNRHRIKNQPLRAIMPVWFLDMLRDDIVMQHPGDGLEVFAIAEAQIAQWFSSRGIHITWALDGEAGQDYASLTKAGAGAGGTVGLADYPSSVIWYLFAEGTFAFMDGGTLDLGLVRDSTLNAANDYQMFVETFENVVRFGHESLRVTSVVTPTGQGTADKALS